MRHPLQRRSVWILRLAACGAFVVLATGCSLFPRNLEPPEPVFSDPALAPILPPVGAGGAPTMAASLERDLVAAWVALTQSTDANEAMLAQRMLLKGISVVDARCDAYFHSLGLAAQKQAFGQRELSLTTGVVAALQGLTGVSTKDIAITGAGLGFLGASSSAYGDAFIFSPQVSSVQALVGASQAAAKQKIEDVARGDYSKAQAVFLLQEYEKTCEVHTIRRLINESLTSAKPVVAFSADDVQAAAFLKATKAQLAALLKVDRVTDDELTALYWLSYKPPAASASSEREVLAKQLANFKDLVANDKLKSEEELAKVLPSVRAMLVPMLDVAVVAARLELGLVALKQTKTAGGSGSGSGSGGGGGGGGAGGGTAQPLPAPAAGVAGAKSLAPRSFAPSLTIKVLQ